MDIKQVIVYRRDLTMRKGKIAAQVAHASEAVFFKRMMKLSDLSQSPDKAVAQWQRRWQAPLTLVIPVTEEMATWVQDLYAKIVLSCADEPDLLRIYELAKAAGIPTALITDAGKTEFHGVPTHTTVALGPASAEDIDKITGPNGAVTCKLA
jgi:PTH2 family peptidyl-tRNA hydrolase